MGTQLLIVIIDATWNVNAIMKFRMRRRVRYKCDAPHPLSLDGKYHMFCSRENKQSRIYKIGVLYDLQKSSTLKKSYKRPPHIFSSSSESKIRSIEIHDHMNQPMSNSGSVSFCIPKCVILLTQTKHV